jgi:hypothetical protein
MKAAVVADRRTRAPLLQLALLAAVALPAFWFVGLPSLIGFQVAPARDFADRPTTLAASTFLVSDFQRLPCLAQRRYQARLQRMSSAVDWLGPGVDDPSGADHPLDCWEKLDRWSYGYTRRFDPFFGEDF